MDLVDLVAKWYSYSNGYIFAIYIRHGRHRRHQDIKVLIDYLQGHKYTPAHCTRVNLYVPRSITRVYGFMSLVWCLNLECGCPHGAT
eukprot:SAG11_NODE_23669_length_384_cov_3.277193_1_plen_86_part_10